MVGGVAAEGDAPIGGAPDGPPVAGWLPSVGTAPLAAMVMWAAPDVSVGTPSSVGGTVCAYPGLGRGAITIDHIYLRRKIVRRRPSTAAPTRRASVRDLAATGTRSGMPFGEVRGSSDARTEPI